MTVRQAIMGLLQLCSVLLFLGIGLFLVGVYFVPECSFALENALLTQPDLFALAGFALLGFATLLAAGFYGTNRGRTLLLRMGTSVDVKLIQRTIAPLFHKQFEDRIALRDIQILQGNNLMIGLQFAPMTPEQRDQNLLEAERHLQTLLIERFGFSKPFTVQAVL